MKPANRHRRGLMLLLAVISIAMVMLLLSSLTVFAASRYREEQAARARCTARAVSPSVAAYARERLAEWSTHPPASPVEVDIRGLLTPELSGSATISVVTDQGRMLCRARVEVSRGPAVIVDEFDIELPK